MGNYLAHVPDSAKPGATELALPAGFAEGGKRRGGAQELKRDLPLGGSEEQGDAKNLPAQERHSATGIGTGRG